MKKYNYKQIINIAIVVALLAWCVVNIGLVFSLIAKIFSVLSPFVYGCLIAFIMNVLLRPIERNYDRLFVKEEGTIAAKLKRPLSIVICLLIVFGILFAIIFLIAPGFYKSLLGFAQEIPQYAKNLNNWWASVAAFAAKYGVSIPDQLINTKDLMNSVADYLNSSGGSLLESTIDKTTGLLSGIISAFLAIIFAIYILSAKEKLEHSSKNFLYAVFPQARAERLTIIARVTDETFTSFISGQCIEACVFGLMSFIGLLVFKFPFAGMIAVVLGFTTLIPVFGAFIGGAIGFVLIALTNPIKGLWFLLFLICLQQFDNNIVYPRIVGKSVGLPGMLVLLAVTVGGSGFGILGMLLSVPICAVLYGLFKEFVSGRLRKKGIDEL